MQEEDFCMWVVLSSSQRLFLLALQLNSETKFKLKKLIYYPSSFLQFCDLEWIPSCVCVCVCVVMGWESLLLFWARDFLSWDFLRDKSLAQNRRPQSNEEEEEEEEPASSGSRCSCGPICGWKSHKMDELDDAHRSILCYGRRSLLIWWSSSWSWMQQKCLSSSSAMNSCCFVVWFISSEKTIVHNRRRRRRNTFSVWCCCWLPLLAVQTVAACWMWWWVSVGFILSPISAHPFASSRQICRFHVVGCCKSSATSRKRTRTLSVPLSGFWGCCGSWIVEV